MIVKGKTPGTETEPEKSVDPSKGKGLKMVISLKTVCDEEIVK